MKATDDYKPGDVFQIVPEHGRNGWIGAFVMATEIRTWGIIGFIHCLETSDKHSQAYIRLAWDDIEFVGHAPLILEEETA